jgi:hypothetical protein
MKTLDERKMLHRSSLKPRMASSGRIPVKAGLNESIVEEGGKIYRKMNLRGESFYTELKAEKE